MSSKHDFRSIKNATFDPILPPKADPKRVGLVAAGNPDVIAEARGEMDYARKRKRRGGRVKRLDPISGAHARHRLDRRSRRKFASGGNAAGVADDDHETPVQPLPPAGQSWLPPKYRATGQGADAINHRAEAIG